MQNGGVCWLRPPMRWHPEANHGTARAGGICLAVCPHRQRANKKGLPLLVSP